MLVMTGVVSPCRCYFAKLSENQLPLDGVIMLWTPISVLFFFVLYEKKNIYISNIKKESSKSTAFSLLCFLCSIQNNGFCVHYKMCALFWIGSGGNEGQS